MKNFTEQDTNPVSWNEVEQMLTSLQEQVSKYFTSRNEKIDIIAPLLRTGGIVGGMLAIKMHITTLLPVQFKYSYHPTEISQITSIPDILVGTPPNPNILLCEGNTSSGSTAMKAAKAIKEKYPTAKIYLATLTKVFDCPVLLDGIEETFCSRITNENFKATEEEIERYHLRKGITIFPWEKTADELVEINSA